MAKKTIFCVGFDLPGEEFEYIPFESDRSLLDADIILYEPTLGRFTSSEWYSGKQLIGEWDSARVPDRLLHWKSELANAVNVGKLVIVYLRKPREAYRYTGRNEYSGTGRNQKVTNIVEPIQSYSAVPRIEKIVPAEGVSIKQLPDAAFLAQYWKEVAASAKYEVYIEGKFSQVLLQTKTGERTVGAMVRGKGSLFFLPPISYPKSFLKHDYKTEKNSWTPDALKFGKRLVAAIVGLAATLELSGAATPPPVWSNDPSFELEEERRIRTDIGAVDTKLTSLKRKRDQLEANLASAGSFRALLYEQGKPLESAILEALRILGFSADGLKEGESEFDAVFTSEEGRFIGEAEGKDSKPINIDKLSQLERNLQEDFQHDEISEYAKGVLFGNAHRLLHPQERGDPFTAKCVSGAKRAKIALIRTCDLFPVVKYLKAHDDLSYAKACRQAIFAAEGELVIFPALPLEETVNVAEESGRQE